MDKIQEFIDKKLSSDLSLESLMFVIAFEKNDEAFFDFSQMLCGEIHCEDIDREIIFTWEVFTKMFDQEPKTQLAIAKLLGYKK